MELREKLKSGELISLEGGKPDKDLADKIKLDKIKAGTKEIESKSGKSIDNIDVEMDIVEQIKVFQQKLNKPQISQITQIRFPWNLIKSVISIWADNKMHQYGVLDISGIFQNNNYIFFNR